MVTSPAGRVLLDCGATTPLALKREGLNAGDIDAILVSHLHGDHFAGIPFMLLENVFEVPRDRALTVVGPPGTPERIQELYRALYRELSVRPLPFELRHVEARPGRQVQLGEMTVLPFEVPHQENALSLGYRATVLGKHVLYSGDTGWTEALVEQSRDADLFICECCYFETHVNFHLDYPTIDANRGRFGCRRMILTHIGREVHRRRAEVKMEVAEDGMVVEL